jgi:hypothetical protein
MFPDDLSSPGSKWAVITPNDSADIPDGPVRSMWASAAGAIRFLPANSDTPVTINVVIGPVPAIARRVYVTGTTVTANNLHGIW